MGGFWLVEVITTCRFASIRNYINNHYRLVVSTPLKNMSQNGNLPQIGLKINII